MDLNDREQVRVLEYLIRTFEKNQKFKTPHIFCASHFEIINPLLFEVFELDREKDNLLGFAEGAEIVFDYSGDSRKVPMKIKFRGQEKEVFLIGRQEKLNYKNIMQKEIIEALKNGMIEYENSLPKHIRTTISNLFIFDKQVYKIYRDDNEFFNELFFDLSRKSNRFDFTERDFNWNYFFTPNIYTDLFSCRLEGGRVVFCNRSQAEELVVVMKKINTEDGLAIHYYKQDMDLSKAGDIGSQLAIQLNRLPEVESDLNLIQAMEVRKKSTIDWISSQPDFIGGSELDSYISCFEALFDEYQKSLSRSECFGPCLDIHLENLIYSEGQLMIIDSYLPKIEWVKADMNLNFYRCAADMLALAGRENFEELKRTYKSASRRSLNEEFENFYIFYGALVSTPTLFELGKIDERRMALAEKYRIFLKDFVKNV